MISLRYRFVLKFEDVGKKAVESDGSSQNKALLSTTLANLKHFDEALKYIEEALKSDPQNKEYEELRKNYQAKLEK